MEYEQKPKQRKSLNFFIEIIIFAIIVLVLDFAFSLLFSAIASKIGSYDTLMNLATASQYIEFIVYPIVASLVLFKVIEKNGLKVWQVILFTLCFGLLARIIEVYVLGIVYTYGEIAAVKVSYVLTFTMPFIKAFMTVPVIRGLGAPAEIPDMRDIRFKKGLFPHIVLLICTFGIYYHCRIFKVTKYLNCLEDEKYRKPAGQLLLCMFIPFYHIFWAHKNARKIDKLSAQSGIGGNITLVCTILEIFVPIVTMIIMQDKINKIINSEEYTEDMPS